MELTESQVRQIIQEEIRSLLKESSLDALRQRAGGTSPSKGKKIAGQIGKGVKSAVKATTTPAAAASGAVGGVTKSIGAAFRKDAQGYDGNTNLGDPSNIKNAQSDIERVLKFMTTNKQVEPLIQRIAQHPLKKTQFINQMMQWMKVPVEDLSKIQAKVKAQMKTNKQAEPQPAEE